MTAITARVGVLVIDLKTSKVSDKTDRSSRLGQRTGPRGPGRRVPRPVWGVEVRQDHRAAHDRAPRKVSSGSIRIRNRDVTNVLPKYGDIAMVFQSYALCTHMTVFANIAYPLTVRGQPKAEVEAAVKDVDGGAITVKADKSFDRRDGAPIGVDFADASAHVFAKDSGDGIR
jgi:hypothetical protein